MSRFEEKTAHQWPKWSSVLFSLISAILGSVALSYTWLRYQNLLSGSEANWYSWIQPIFTALMGILCLWAAILFIADQPSGWSVLKVGLSMVPLLLFSNLVVLVFRVILNFLQGNGISVLSRLYASPLNKALLALLFLIIILSIVKESKK